MHDMWLAVYSAKCKLAVYSGGGVFLSFSSGLFVDCLWAKYPGELVLVVGDVRELWPFLVALVVSYKRGPCYCLLTERLL